MPFWRTPYDVIICRSKLSFTLKVSLYIVMKTQNQNPLLGHKGHEISKKPVLFLQLQTFLNHMHFTPKLQQFIRKFTKFSLCYGEQYVERFIHNMLSTSHYANAGGDALLKRTYSVLFGLPLMYFNCQAQDIILKPT